MKDEIKAAYQQVHDLWAGVVVEGAAIDLLEPLGKAVNALRDAALIAVQPGLRQVRCVDQNGIVHAANQRDGKPLCGQEFTLGDSIDIAVRVPTCLKCQEMIIHEKAKV